MDDLFDVLTEALLNEQYDIDHIVEEYDIPRSKVAGLVGLIDSLREALAVQKPSEEFVQSLKLELLGNNDGLLNRLRALPGRVQIAAGLALVAGFVLISRRRLTNDEEATTEVPALQ